MPHHSIRKTHSLPTVDQISIVHVVNYFPYLQPPAVRFEVIRVVEQRFETDNFNIQEQCRCRF